MIRGRKFPAKCLDNFSSMIVYQQDSLSGQEIEKLAMGFEQSVNVRSDSSGNLAVFAFSDNFYSSRVSIFCKLCTVSAL